MRLGFLMIMDITHERGMADIDVLYGTRQDCSFPLFDFLKPFEPQWMIVIYTIMLIGDYIQHIKHNITYQC